MDKAFNINSYIEDGNNARKSLSSDKILRVAEVMTEALMAGKKILCMGNGGSAADSQHFVAELVGRFEAERKALPAIALTTNSSITTAIANDYSYEMVFARQVEALANSGDVVVGISTSGNSKNVIAAMESARQIGCILVTLTGQKGKLMEMADPMCDITVSSPRTSTIQEAHICAIHIISKLIEDKFTGV
jgi:D-sedoheptulose 7-phosphate isomerase